MKNDADLLLRVRGDKKSRKKNNSDMLLRVRRDEKRTEKNDADMLLRVILIKMRRVRMTKSKKR